MPFYAVNHLGGHLAADVYDHGPLPESVGLLVSGGHTNLLHVRSLGEPIAELGSTVDDAAGEAYDKIARLLGLGYPGGRVLDDLARTGDRDAIAFPRGMTGPRDDPYAFSFSGLKTAVARYVESHPDAPHRRRRGGFPGGGGRRADAQGGACRDRTRRLHAVDRRGGRGQLTAARAGRRALCGSRSDVADPPAAAVHRQWGDDRVLRRTPDRGGCAAVAVGRAERPGPAGGEGTGGVSAETDKLAVTELLYRYAELIDAGDFDGVGTLLAATADSSWASRAPRRSPNCSPRPPAASRITATPRGPDTWCSIRSSTWTVTRHSTARSTFCVVQQTETVALQPIAVGRYADTFGRDGAGWHFTERKVDIQMIGDVSDHLMIDPGKFG